MGLWAAEVNPAGKRANPPTNLPLPGPVGGPCLEKDSYILAESVERYGIKPEMTLAARMINERQPDEVVAAIKAHAERLGGLPAKPVVAMLGIAFKGRPPTDDLRGTTARPLLAKLKEAFPGAGFRGFDAVVPADAQRAFGLEPMASLPDALAGANIAVFHNNHALFAAMPLETLADSMGRPGIIYDLWNNFARGSVRMPEGRIYICLGSHGGQPPS
jgi:UDP-N-acetyl-D-mannosaminuronic acid dehydrogenase